MVQPFEGQVAIVTGGASGIGRETARLFAERGMAGLVISDVDAQSGEQAVTEVQERGARGLFVDTDVTNEDRVRSMVEQAQREFGRIDVLLNAAGSPIRRCTFLDSDLATWQASLDLNVIGSYLCAREAIPHMLKQGKGSIVNIASVAAYMGNPHTSIHYAAAKGAVVSMTVGLGREFAERGIRVNAIAPGAVDTPFHDKFSPPGFLDRIMEITPMKRMGSPRELAELIGFLCSDACAYMSGAIVRVDGGMFA